MLPRPPTSTLFPYTTLFRSLVTIFGALGRIHRSGMRWSVPMILVALGLWGWVTGGLGAARDRKSTRLNSSHPSISYAVFCLKKKKKTEEHKIDGCEIDRTLP